VAADDFEAAFTARYALVAQLLAAEQASEYRVGKLLAAAVTPNGALHGSASILA